MLKYCQSNRLGAIELSVDTGILITLISFIIGASTYIAILSYKVRQIETHPLFVALKEFQTEQIVDLLKNLYKEREK
jgi:hypothetical protein